MADALASLRAGSRLRSCSLELVVAPLLFTKNYATSARMSLLSLLGSTCFIFPRHLAARILVKHEGQLTVKVLIIDTRVLRCNRAFSGSQLLIVMPSHDPHPRYVHFTIVN